MDAAAGPFLAAGLLQRLLEVISLLLLHSRVVVPATVCLVPSTSDLLSCKQPGCVDVDDLIRPQVRKMLVVRACISMACPRLAEHVQFQRLL